jgi:hypothetical protein
MFSQNLLSFSSQNHFAIRFSRNENVASSLSSKAVNHHDLLRKGQQIEFYCI